MEYYVTLSIQIIVDIPSETPEDVIEDEIINKSISYLQSGDFDRTYDSIELMRYEQ